MSPDDARPTKIRLLAWGPAEDLQEVADPPPEELAGWEGRCPMVWVDVVGLGDLDLLRRVGEVVGLHPLALEDVLNVHHQAKLDVSPDGLFAIARFARAEEGGHEQISFWAKPGFVVTFRDSDDGDLEPIRRRLGNPNGRLRQRAEDYFLYAMVDVVIDGYFPVLDRLGEDLERVEEALFEDPEALGFADLHQLRRRAHASRRTLLPHRELVAGLRRHDTPGVSDETRLFLGDAVDHVVRLLEIVDGHGDLAAQLMDVSMSMIGQRTNEVMKLLTIVATIFIPLSFVAGLYGMNFDTSSPWNMPELSWRYGYLMAWGMMLTLAGGFLWFLRRKGWL